MKQDFQKFDKGLYLAKATDTIQYHELWLYCDIPNRQNIDDDWIALLQYLDNFDKSKPILIRISGNGGGVKDFFELYCVLRKFNIFTVCNSFAHSASFNLWCAGEERFVSEFADLLYHEPSAPVNELWRATNANERTNLIIRQNKLGQTRLNLKQILTQEEIAQAQYGHVFLLGADLIKRGVARNSTGLDTFLQSYREDD